MRSSTVSTASLLICLSSLLPLGTASGQASRKGRLTEPLEKYGMPPAPLGTYRLDSSPRTISPYGTFTSLQVHVDAQGNNIVGDAANEPTISVDPTDGNKIAIGWRQFDTWTSNFRQAGYGYTTDAGTTWHFPGVLQNGVFRSDPVTNSDDTGNFFYLSLLVNTFCGDIWRSTNGGQTWTERSPDGGAHSGDKEWFTVDRTPASMGHGFQYQFWTGIFACDFGEFSRSTDGGVTWQAPINIPNSAQWGTLDVASNGYLFIGGGDTGSSFWCIRSTNAQNPGVTPTFDQVTTVNMGGSLVYGGTVNPGGLAGQIFLVVDRSGGPTNNNIYMLASVRPFGGNGTDVMFARSTDGGLSFSAPQRINDDPVNPNKWHWFGTLAVAPNGRIDVVWHDTRNAANNTDSQLFYSYSTDGGATNDYQMIINFATSVTVESASVTSGTGSVSSFSVSGSQVTVNLTGVTNVQRITVTLHNVNDGTSTGDVPVSMGVLVGDVNGNAVVNASDVSLTKSQVGQPVTGSNFREDVNANGTISATDVAQVKAEVGTALP